MVRALRADASGAQHVTGATGEAGEVTGPPEGARFLGSVARLRGVLAPALWRQEGVRKLRDRTGRGRGAGRRGESSAMRRSEVAVRSPRPRRHVKGD